MQKLSNIHGKVFAKTEKVVYHNLLKLEEEV
jgi:hypothetical protein